MRKNDEGKEADFFGLMQKIRDSDASDVDKVAQAFDHITCSIIEHAQHEIELARAMFDEDTVVKQQVKMETMKGARGIFQDCYRLTLGRRAWDE